MIIIRKLIDWKLLNNNEVIIDLKNVICEYVENDYLLFLEDDTINRIDLKNNKYQRKTKDYNMEVNFLDKTCKFSLPEKEDLTFDVKTALIINNNKIIVKYNYDTEEKKINITLKEDE